MSEPHPDEAGRDRAYKVGISVGLEQASKILMDRAVDGFKIGNKYCDELRHLAVTLKQKSDEAHPGVKR